MKLNHLDKQVIHSKSILIIPLKANTKHVNKLSDMVVFYGSRAKRSSDADTLEEATERKIFTYWLSQEDIADIARLEYDNYNKQGSNDDEDAEFEVLGSTSQLSTRLEAFQLVAPLKKTARLTLIINLANLHWVTLVVSYKNSGYIGYYVDSKDNPLPSEYYQLLVERFKLRPISLSPGFPQQTDGHNCGLWALENARDLCWMLEEDHALYLLIDKLKKPRDKSYFDEKRKSLSEKLRIDLMRYERHRILSSDPNTSASKQFELQPEEERIKIIGLLETFVESSIAAFIKKIGAYHVTAKGERLTEESLKTELKTGITGALLGIALSQSIIGAIPSLVASLRLLSSKYYLSKAKAQKVTKAFSETGSSLSYMLSEAAVEIFCSFESQFMLVDDKAGKKIAMEKLAEDAVERALNYIVQLDNSQGVISKQLLTKSVLLGQSEKFFDPRAKPARLRISGNKIQDEDGNAINTANLYEKVGLTIINSQAQSNKFYKNKEHANSNQYGYRRLLDWEKEESGELKEAYKQHYEEESLPQRESRFQFKSRRYKYVLEIGAAQAEARRILNKIENRISSPTRKAVDIEQTRIKPPILFDLRKPIENFTGRTKILSDLHTLLITGRTTAVITTLSTLSIYPKPDAPSLQGSGSLISVSGLGGIGKTQLALRYAELYASFYHCNVLWINAETKENIANSFRKLANKLRLDTQDRYNQEKSTEEIAEEVYDYFSDRKSLFIFDNAENYRAIDSYLPKSMLGNKPTLLITSRHSNWKNITPVLSLDVFTEEEAIELIKKVLNLSDNTQNAEIKELNAHLQGLPLALQQALAYISLRKNTQAEFGICDYIELYKEKAQELLSFDFSNYTNDPYIRTIFTTWQITLDKIQGQNFGKKAIEVLNMISYLDPDNISSGIFYHLKHIDYSEIGSSIDASLNLLSSYSMITRDEERNKYTIHRLVQQVVRMQLEVNRAQFIEIIEKIQKLFIYSKFSKEENFHFLHFLLYMSEYKGLNSILLFGETSRMLFSRLIEQDIKYWFYFIDLAYIKFKKAKYLEFLGDSLIFCMKKNFFLFLSETLDYIEKKWEKGKLSKENVKYIIWHIYSSKDSVFSVFKLSRIPEKRERQREIGRLFYLFKEKVFGGMALYLQCSSHNLKRSMNACLLSEPEGTRVETMNDKKFKSHFKKLAQVSHWIQSGLLTKDTVSALLQGDFNTVAVNFALITSSQVLGKISNVLRTSGEILAIDNEPLLENNLGLESKNIYHILFSEEVLSTSKRHFFSNAMKVASPFVARGTSIFFGYNLMNEIKDYKAGNVESLPDIISNGITVGVDGTEAGIEGLEFLDLIPKLSEFTGPIGEATAALTWLGSDIYHAEHQVEEIEKHVHLSETEKFIQGVRAFFYLAPSGYLNVKASNNQLVQRAVDFLKKHTEIRQYIFPTFRSETTLYEHNEVLWNERGNLIVDDSNPDEPSEGHLFCLADIIAQSTRLQKNLTYHCRNAIGIEYPLHRTSDISFFNLERGDDIAIALPFSPALFLVQNGKKMFKGSHKGNLFILEGDSITGMLQGGNGTDIIKLSNYFPRKSDYLLIDANEFLCGKSGIEHYPPFCRHPNDSSIKLNKIDQIYGRKNEQDIIYLNRNTRFIDGYGGRNKEHPDIFFITDRSYKNPKFVLRNNTILLFSLSTDINSIDYSVPKDEVGETHIQFNFSEAIQHRFFFECFFEKINAISINDSIIFSQMSVNPEETFQVIISDFRTEENSLLGNSTNLANISCFFKGMEIKLLNKDRLYIREIEHNSRTIDEKINLFIKIATRLEKAFSIQLMDNSTLFIGHGRHEIFYTNAVFESHLVGNGGENVYVIFPMNQSLFPLAETILYDTSKRNEYDLEELTDTLDLREIIKKTKQICQHESTSSSVSSSGNDLILNLSANCPSNILIANIKLKNALLDNWYQKLDIFWDGFLAKNIIAINNATFMLTPLPLIFSSNKEIMVITDKDIEKKSEILILKNIGNYSFFRNQTDLILTNSLTNPNDFCTFICHQFYQLTEMREKILSAVFIFFDRSIRPQDNLTEISHAVNFSDSHVTQATRSKRQANLKKTISARYQEQAKQSQENKDYFRWILGAGAITLSTTALIASARYLFIRRLRSQEKSVLFTAIVTGTTISATLFQGAQTKEAPQKMRQRNSLRSEAELDIKRDCVKSASAIGVLGICIHATRVIVWQEDSNRLTAHFKSYLLNRSESNNHYLDYESSGQWVLDLSKINRTALENIHYLLPPRLFRKLAKKNAEQQIFIVWKQQIIAIMGCHIVHTLSLHTPLGNLFKTLGLSLNWRERDDIHVLNRCFITIQQLLSHRAPSEKLLSLSVGLLEVALLHPYTQSMYAYLMNNNDFSKEKLVIRFISDLLQLGFYNFSYLARLLEFFFPNSESILKIGLGIRMVSHFYLLTEDLSYWYLGMALFVLPYLPNLLENFGIPLTRRLHELSNQLVQSFIGQSLLNQLSLDEERVEQHTRELTFVDERTRKGKERVKNFLARPWSNFWSGPKYAENRYEFKSDKSAACLPL